VKIRVLIVGGAVAALSTLSLAANAAPGQGGNCTTSTKPTPPAGAQQVPLPDGGFAYAGGDQTSGAVGSQGPKGWIQGSGGTASNGGHISGYQTESGLNGSLTIGAAPAVCVAVNGTGVHS
jgi:hypothetical protein